MAKNTLTSWPTWWDWEKKNKFSPMNENISSILQDKKIVEDPRRIKNFEREVSHYILTCCLKDSYNGTQYISKDKMMYISKDELIQFLKKKFIKNFRGMTQNTANKKIEEAVNNFIIKRSEVLKKDEWEHFIDEIKEERKEARYWRVDSDFMLERTQKNKLKISESELEWIIDDTNKAKDIMRNLDKYVLNLELAKTLAKAWVFHEYTLMPDRKEYVDSFGNIIVLHESIDYSDFWIKKDDITYLRDMSQEIYKEKKLNHSVFDLEDEIDEHFWD